MLRLAVIFLNHRFVARFFAHDGHSHHKLVSYIVQIVRDEPNTALAILPAIEIDRTHSNAKVHAVQRLNDCTDDSP